MHDQSDPLAAEKQFFSSLIVGDVGALDRILGDDFLLIDVMTGSEVKKPDLLAVLGSGQLKFEAIQPVESQVRLYGITAVITGRTQMSGRFGEAPFTASSRYTHVFVKDQSQWRVHPYSLVSDFVSLGASWVFSFQRVSQRLTVMHTAVHHLVPQRLMHALGHIIVNPSVGRHLNAPLAACPVFCRGQESPAYPPVSMILNNVPTLDIAHRADRVAAVRVRTQVDFQEPSYSMTRLSDQNDERHRYRSLAFEN
jgi:hypothetical protein